MITRAKGKTLSQEETKAVFGRKTPTRKRLVFIMANARIEETEIERLCIQVVELVTRDEERDRCAQNVERPPLVIEDEYRSMTNRHRNASFEGGIDANNFELKTDLINTVQQIYSWETPLKIKTLLYLNS